MPTLVCIRPGQPVTVKELSKRVFTVGSKPDCDIVVSEAAELEANIVQTPDGWAIHPYAPKPIAEIDGKRLKRESRLADGSVVHIASSRLVFSEAAAPASAPDSAVRGDSAAILESLANFAAKLGDAFTLDDLLPALMDGLIELCGADRGFLLLNDDDGYAVRVARNVEKEKIADASSLVSDSIVKRVIESGQAVLVGDALQDDRFQAAQSVMDLQVSSVLAVPLRIRGEVLGVIYLGNNRVRSRFDESKRRLAELFASQAALLLTNLLSMRDLEAKLDAQRLGEILGSCESIQSVFRKMEKVSRVDVPVLITGETGTGKELAAREIHRLSDKQGRFVSLNCGAIPENLIESELFGHVKGAFTGAVKDRMGCFQSADGGTLFLDEIGELAIHLQVKLLRVLQDQVVTKVGSDTPETVEVRVIAATNRNLETEVAEGRFREDLLYRLNVIPIELPALRDRGDDVILLAKYFLQRYREELLSTAKDFSRDALLSMRDYEWPGNIRELENRIKRALVLTEGLQLTPADLELKEPGEVILTLQDAKERFQGEYIDRVLALNGGNRNKTADDLGVDPRTIYRHLAKKREDGEGEGEPEQETVAEPS